LASLGRSKRSADPIDLTDPFDLTDLTDPIDSLA
jgi:hypothetical protein